jgi:phosphoglycerate dehydrogenase-like enzyme
MNQGKSMPTIVVFINPEEMPPHKQDRIQELAPDMALLVTNDRPELEGVLHDVEILTGWFPHDLILEMPNLRWAQQWGAGANWLMRYPKAVEMDFILTNASGLHAVPISEHILAFLFTFARGFHHAYRFQADREWGAPDEGEVFELAGKTILLVGVGAIGARTAQLAAALGMRVIGIRRNPQLGPQGLDAVFGPDQLPEQLPRADFVVLAMPLNHETKGMIAERELRLMKASAYLVNIGRGATVDENALVQALREGWIAGAGLDVFETEPLPAESPLWNMPNVVITAHYAGRTPHYFDRAMSIFLDNLERYTSGRPLFNVVDKEWMY